jgi:hypothetical protein
MEVIQKLAQKLYQATVYALARLYSLNSSTHSDVYHHKGFGLGLSMDNILGAVGPCTIACQPSIWGVVCGTSVKNAMLAGQYSVLTSH